jgi:hypothetical protein
VSHLNHSILSLWMYNNSCTKQGYLRRNNSINNTYKKDPLMTNSNLACYSDSPFPYVLVYSMFFTVLGLAAVYIVSSLSLS